MVFASLEFLYFFLPVSFVCYFLTPKKYRNFILLIISYLFYAWGEPIYISLLLVSTLVDYTIGHKIDKHRGSVKARNYLVLSLVVNLGLLGFFKYSDFLIININHLLNTSFRTLDLPLPIGISFFTFQTMSYSIDLYKDKVKLQKNIIDFGTYVSLFPQLIAGPIVRYATVENELYHRKTNINQINDGLERFMIGLGKKVIIANQMGYVWQEIKPLSQPGTFLAWIGIISFAFQIFYDFSGYSDMAIGLGKIFGFHFLENFNKPYLSKSITEFWRRWHISLGTWFREYVYIPLGGNRLGRGRHVINILIVWSLTGFWHGASWNFMLWGFYFGIILLIEKFILIKIKLPRLVSHIYTIILILVGWVLFEFETVLEIGGYLKNMFTYSTGNEYIELVVKEYLVFYILSIITLFEPLKNWSSKFKTPFAVLVLFLSTLYLIEQGFNPFIYFRF